MPPQTARSTQVFGRHDRRASGEEMQDWADHGRLEQESTARMGAVVVVAKQGLLVQRRL